MKTKHILLLILISLFLLVCFSYNPYLKGKLFPNKDNAKVQIAVGVAVSTISVSTTTQYSKITVEYPKWTGVKDEFNQSISTYVNNSLADFNKASEENWNARISTALPDEKIEKFPPENEKFEFIVEWTLSQMNNDRISFLITIYQFSGGAHGSTIMKSFNYDVKSQKDIVLSDIFKNNKNYLEKISSYSISNLKNQLLDSGMTLDDSIKEGAGPKLSNFEIFTISRNKLTIYFPQYSIGPYSLGIKTVDIYNWDSI